jgi:hypothetical protein
MRFDLGSDLETLRAAALARIDAEAEAARLLFLTPGAGQAMEYLATEAEARAFLAAAAGIGSGKPTSLDGYPLVAAVARALAAVGNVVQPAALAEQLVAQADAWRAAGAAIKELRRAARMRIAGAETAAGVRRAAEVRLPAPRR